MSLNILDFHTTTLFDFNNTQAVLLGGAPHKRRLARGEYGCVLALVRVLQGGAAAKRWLDRVVDQCAEASGVLVLCEWCVFRYMMAAQTSKYPFFRFYTWTV